MSDLVEKKEKEATEKQKAKVIGKEDQDEKDKEGLSEHSSEGNESDHSEKEEEQKEAAIGDKSEPNKVVDAEADTKEDPEEETKEAVPEKPVMMSLQRCAKCSTVVLKYATQVKSAKQQDAAYWKENERMTEILEGLKEREKRTLMRQIKAGEIDYDPKLDKLVYTESKEEYVFGKEEGSDDGSQGDEDDDEL